MSKTRRHRQRRHNGKLSRRMKKRGGVPKSSVPKSSVPKSSLRRDELEKRPMFLEPLHGVHKVNTKDDEAKQLLGLEKCKDKFKSIQNFAIRQLRIGTGKIVLNKNGHDGKWMCVKCSQEGYNTYAPCEREITDDFLKGEDGREWISTQNSNNIFCVPENYEKIMYMWSQFGWLDYDDIRKIREQNELLGAARWY